MPEDFRLSGPAVMEALERLGLSLPKERLPILAEQWRLARRGSGKLSTDWEADGIAWFIVCAENAAKDLKRRQKDNPHFQEGDLTPEEYSRLDSEEREAHDARRFDY